MTASCFSAGFSIDSGLEMFGSGGRVVTLSRIVDFVLEYLLYRSFERADISEKN